MPCLLYSTQPWTCKNFDEEECAENVANSLSEHYNTVYDCVFLPPQASAAEGFLVAGYQSGDIRLFDWQRVCRSWLATRGEQSHELSWKGHSGAVYAVSLLQSAEYGNLLVTAGDDGYVRVWRSADLLTAAHAACSALVSIGNAGSSSNDSRQPVSAAAAVQLPHMHNPLGISAGNQPAAQVLAVDDQQQRVFAGASDGGVHVLDIRHLSHIAAQQHSTSGTTAAAVVSLQGHAAGVLGLDYSHATQQLASASEDGTIRIWNCSSNPHCLTVINPWDDDKPNPGVVPMDQPLELLKCIKLPPVTCVRFSREGQFLIAGNAAGSLVLWNCMDQSLAAKQVIRDDEVKCIPQVLLLSPGLVTVAGTDGRLYQFTFQLESVRSMEVGAESVFGVASETASGMLAVCGSKGCIDLLSEQGAVSGLIRPPASVLIG